MLTAVHLNNNFDANHTALKESSDRPAKVNEILNDQSETQTEFSRNWVWQTMIYTGAAIFAVNILLNNSTPENLSTNSFPFENTPPTKAFEVPTAAFQTQSFSFEPLKCNNVPATVPPLTEETQKYINKISEVLPGKTEPPININLSITTKKVQLERDEVQKNEQSFSFNNSSHFFSYNQRLNDFLNDQLELFNLRWDSLENYLSSFTKQLQEFARSQIELVKLRANELSNYFELGRHIRPLIRDFNDFLNDQFELAQLRMSDAIAFLKDDLPSLLSQSLHDIRNYGFEFSLDNVRLLGGQALSNIQSRAGTALKTLNDCVRNFEIPSQTRKHAWQKTVGALNFDFSLPYSFQDMSSSTQQLVTDTLNRLSIDFALHMKSLQSSLEEQTDLLNLRLNELKEDAAPYTEQVTEFLDSQFSLLLVRTNELIDAAAPYAKQVTEFLGSQFSLLQMRANELIDDAAPYAEQVTEFLSSQFSLLQMRINDALSLFTVVYGKMYLASYYANKIWESLLHEADSSNSTETIDGQANDILVTKFDDVFALLNNQKIQEHATECATSAQMLKEKEANERHCQILDKKCAKVFQQYHPDRTSSIDQSKVYSSVIIKCRELLTNKLSIFDLNFSIDLSFLHYLFPQSNEPDYEPDYYHPPQQQRRGPFFC